MTTFRRGAPTTHFDGSTEGHALDIIKAYTWIMLNTRSFPSFSDQDVYERYDGHALEDPTLYLCRAPNKQSIQNAIQFPDTTTLKYGKFLKGISGIQILGFVRPTFIVPNPYIDAIKAIFANPELTDEEKKKIPLSAWGEMGRLKKEQSQSNGSSRTWHSGSDRRQGRSR